MTVDFGFYRAAIGDLVFADFTEDGDLDGSPDGPLAGATVQLFMSNGTTEIPVGPDGIIGTSDDALGGVTTLADGLYSFVGLPSGDYIVKVTRLLVITARVMTIRKMIMTIRIRTPTITIMVLEPRLGRLQRSADSESFHRFGSRYYKDQRDWDYHRLKPRFWLYLSLL